MCAGLKLTCDCDCKGNILIHDGFAIDDCGNDLVVCETTRFDVIAALRNKNLLVYDLPEEDCEPRRHESRCHIKQCFYITICYQETESGYETPFQTGSTAGPKQCMPTRTHESVRFDVTDKLPREHSYLEDLEERIRHCFEVQCNSPVGVIMKKHAPELLEIFGEGEIQGRERQYDPCELFCTLRAYFLNHLKTNPDQFNCNLTEEVQCLTCPRGWERRLRRPETREAARAARTRTGRGRISRFHREEVREAFRKLLYYIQRYQYDWSLWRPDLLLPTTLPRGLPGIGHPLRCSTASWSASATHHGATCGRGKSAASAGLFDYDRLPGGRQRPGREVSSLLPGLRRV